MNRLQTIPRFDIPFDAGDFAAGLSAMFRKRPETPDRLAGLAGEGPRFWTGSGRQALMLILKALRLSPGAGVAVPMYADLAVAGAIAGAGCTPVFVDVDETLTIDPRSLARVSSRISAVVAVYFFGHVARIQEIISAAPRAALIEDTVHAPGSMLGPRLAGQFGVACFYSFGSTKFWPAGGGGVAVLNDLRLQERMSEEAAKLTPAPYSARFRNLTAQAAKAVLFRRPWYGAVGRSLRKISERRQFLEPELDRTQIHPGQAAIAIRQTQRSSTMAAAQRRNGLHLIELLSNLPDMVLPVERPGVRYNYHLFPVLLRDEAETKAMAAAMLRQNVDTSRVYFDLVPNIRRLGYQGGCPVSESIASRMLTLPNHAGLSGEDIEYVAETFKEALSGYRRAQELRSFAIQYIRPSGSMKAAEEHESLSTRGHSQ